MKFIRLIYVLYKIKLLSPLGLYRVIKGVCKYGINMMTLLYIAEKAYSDKTALAYEDEIISYKQLLKQSEKLSAVLNGKYGLKKGQKAAFMCKNSASLVKAIYAVSYLGLDIYLLNAEMSRNQFNSLLDRHKFDFLVYDYELNPLIEESPYTKGRILSCHESLPSIDRLLDTEVNEKTKLQRTTSGKLVLLTGGTTGSFKEAAHKPSLFNYLNPFITLLTRLNLLNYSTAYIATPIYHGYGVAVLFLFTALGKKVVINSGFDAKKACLLVRRHNVEVITVVPLMVYKMLKNSIEDLKSLACIVSGGAELNPKLVEETFSSLGDVLYNLYGTSEAGLNIVATPRDLRYSANTIGRAVEGVRLKLLDANKKEVESGKTGQFCIKNSWSMKSRNNSWIETGDMGYRDDKGYYYLCGRADDMIVSAGENVYPIEVEQVLIKHPQVEDVAVIGIRDDSFGQRLKAFVLPAKDACLSKEELFEWLRLRVARFQLPKDIVFIDNMPYTPLGKLDKKQLKLMG